jgi:dipeptidyl-peptidase-4
MRLFISGLVALLLCASSLYAQNEISLEGIWKNGEFRQNSIPGFRFMNDGQHYTLLEDNAIEKYDLLTGKKVETIFEAAAFEQKDGFPGKINNYEFSGDEKKIILATSRESIYRRSSKSNYYIFDGEKVSQLYDGDKQMYATFNEATDKVAFVFENNLYVKDLKTGITTQITTDGKTNSIINGALDWVYEEEFGFSQGFEWSPDGQKIAFYRFDESEVPQFTMTNYTGELYPDYETFKYPKVGEKNSVVTVHIYDVNTKKTVKAQTGAETDIYFPRIKWTRDPDKLCIFRLNRLQNHLELLLSDAKTGKTEVMFEETNKWYISENVFDDLTFMKSGGHFLWVSETPTGWNHIYMYDMKGNQTQALTSGNWEVSALYGVDEMNGLVYFQAGKESPLNREVYSVSLKGGEIKKLSNKTGWNSARFSNTYDYFVNTFSTANSAPEYTVHDRKGKLLRTIESNQHINELRENYNVSDVEFFNFDTKDDVNLNGWMIKPTDFDPNKKYPVFMYLYGGPGSQQVTNSWHGSNYWWFQMLAQKGYIVACVDNRGTGGRGEEFKKCTYLQLGHYETIDQIESAKYLGNMPYVDANRIGIFGWSYGGYMSSLCLLKGNDVFKAAIAVAPVTSWKWYDTIYTERFMRTLKDNEEGYLNNSPVNFADRLKGNYFLVHGMSDDNVHFQQSAEMANALIEANKQYDTYYYPNQNHSIYGTGRRLHLYTAMTNFLDNKLKNDFSKVGGSEKP